MKKRFLSMILTLSLLVGMFPPIAVSAAAETSGSCGESAAWSFDAATGTLTISGTGATDHCYSSTNSYIGPTAPPWNDWLSQITKVVVKSGITALGWASFYNHDKLTSVTLADTVTDIGYFAFLDCDGLTSFTIPSGFEAIPWGAFRYCRNLTQITIPSSVVSVGMVAFDGCKALTDVYYEGTEEQWGQIKVGMNNDPLLNATIHYNSDIAGSSGGFYPIIKPGIIPNHECQFRIVTRDSSFCVQKGDYLYFDLYFYVDGEQYTEEWPAPEMVAEDGTLISTEAVVEGEYYYRIFVEGLECGNTTLRLSFPNAEYYVEELPEISVPITVVQDLNGPYVRWLNDIPEFYPEVSYDSHLLTNFYNIYGIYINHLSYTPNADGGYHVTMHAFNHASLHGAVDIYDADGIWQGCELIEKFSDIESLYDTAEYIGQMIDNLGHWLAYDSETIGEDTYVEFDLPKGGYFTISNNVTKSPGAMLYNLMDLILLSASLALEVADAGGDTSTNHPLDDLVTQMLNNTDIDGQPKVDGVRNFILGLTESAATDIMSGALNRQAAIDKAETIADSFYHSVSKVWDISGALAVTLGVAEEALKAFSGPAGWGLDTIFSISKYGNVSRQVDEMFNCEDRIPVYIFAHAQGSAATIHGVRVRADSLPADVLVQAIPVQDLDLSEILAAGGFFGTGLQCEGYSLGLFQGDKAYSPKSPVEVSFEAADNATAVCAVLRQTSDGSWTPVSYDLDGGRVIIQTSVTGTFAIVYLPQGTACEYAACPSRHFSDAPGKTSWAHEGIDFAVTQGLFNGTSATAFSPNAAMNRAMLVTVLWRYSGTPASAGSNFTDVSSGQWYTDAIAWAAENGVVNGTGSNRFSPNKEITREQIATILMRYSEKMGFDTSARFDLSAFPDSGRVSSYAADAMQWAVAEGLINGSDGKLLPQGNATRAQVATILMRYILNVLR